MEEFALCWNKLKFAENLSTGFQTLFDRGDFVDCTIACDGQLLQCHKLVLAICSPYFKEIFINNPCRHPIIILKDVSYSIMSELLQFMYQGEVNVKQAELQSFMSIAESLQIKGLATNTNNNNNNNNTHNVKASDPVISTFSQFHANNSITRNNIQHQFNSGGNHAENHRQITSTPLSTTSSVDNHSAKALKMNETPTSPFGQKRTMDQINTVERQNQMKIKRNQMMNDISGDSDMNDSIDNMTSDDMFLPQAMQPQVTINESPRFDTNSVKREVNDVTVSQPQSPNNSYRGLQYQNSNMNSMHNATFPYNFSDFSNNDMTMQNESKPSIHMDIPAVLPGERWISGKLQFMLSQRGKPLLVHDGYSFGIQYIRKDKKYWQCNLSRKYNCKARVTTTDAGDIIVTNNEHCHTEIRQHLRKDYKMNKLHNQLNNQLNSHYMNYGERKMSLSYPLGSVSTSTLTSIAPPSISTTTTSIMPRQIHLIHERETFPYPQALKKLLSNLFNFFMNLMINLKFTDSSY
ncbi:CLUMA_CG006853, isoform B [Clunio marinus]|uniref:CLUMA_CG006853, isoform B n=1 Tax=Clunio marinus TaxID=568069 RepID=A0A1J1I377_9DIPT|nr:CLUMA_CG006853, isoform B [Clunio marinus]